MEEEQSLWLQIMLCLAADRPAPLMGRLPVLVARYSRGQAHVYCQRSYCQLCSNVLCIQADEHVMA